MRVSGYIRTYRGYDVYYDDDDESWGGWYAAPALAGPANRLTDDVPLVVYSTERMLRRAIDATFEAPGR